MPAACPIGRRSAVNRGHSRTRLSGPHLRRGSSSDHSHDLCKQGIRDSGPQLRQQWTMRAKSRSARFREQEGQFRPHGRWQHLLKRHMWARWESDHLPLDRPDLRDAATKVGPIQARVTSGRAESLKDKRPDTKGAKPPLLRISQFRGRNLDPATSPPGDVWLTLYCRYSRVAQPYLTPVWWLCSQLVKLLVVRTSDVVPRL